MNSNNKNAFNSMFGPEWGSDSESTQERISKDELLGQLAEKERQIAELTAERDKAMGLANLLMEKGVQSGQVKSKTSPEKSKVSDTEKKAETQDEFDEFESKRAELLEKGWIKKAKNGSYRGLDGGFIGNDGSYIDTLYDIYLEDKKASESNGEVVSESSTSAEKKAEENNTANPSEVNSEKEVTTSTTIDHRSSGDYVQRLGESEEDWLKRIGANTAEGSDGERPVQQPTILNLNKVLEQEKTNSTQEEQEQDSELKEFEEMRDTLLEKGLITRDKYGFYVDHNDNPMNLEDIKDMHSDYLWSVEEGKRQRAEMGDDTSSERLLQKEEVGRFHKFFDGLKARAVAMGLIGKGQKAVSMLNPAAAAGNVHTAVENKLNERKFFTERKKLVTALAGGVALGVAGVMLAPRIYAAFQGLHTSLNTDMDVDSGHNGILDGATEGIEGMDLNHGVDWILDHEYGTMDNYDAHGLVSDGLYPGNFSNFGGPDGVMEHLGSEATYIDGMEAVSSQSESLEGYVGQFAEMRIPVLEEHGITDTDSAVRVIENMSPEDQLALRNEVFDWLRDHYAGGHDEYISGDYYNMGMSYDGEGGYDLVQSITTENGSLVRVLNFVDDNGETHTYLVKHACGQLVEVKPFQNVVIVDNEEITLPPKVVEKIVPVETVVEKEKIVEVEKEVPADTPEPTPTLEEKHFELKPPDAENDIKNGAVEVHQNGEFGDQTSTQGEALVDQQNQTAEQIAATELAANTLTTNSVEINGENWVWNGKEWELK